MATAKVERLLNLVIALLSTRSYLTADKIRASVKGYDDSPSDAAFSRMFERDKNELRDLGIPLETGRTSVFDTVDGYRINPDAYALPAIELSSEEAAAVAVAVELWQSPELRANAEGAVAKLHAAGVEVDPDRADVLVAAPAALPGIHQAEPALGALMDAVQAGQAVQFDHRPSPVEPYVTRTVEPWGVVTHGGRWYLVGHDRDRDAVRTFRMSRIAPEVRSIGPTGAVTRPETADLRQIVADAVGDKPSGLQARIWVADGRAVALRRAGTVLARQNLAGRDGDVVGVDIGTYDRLAREIAGYGADAVVLEPSSLRDDVMARLSARVGEVSA
ncbi:helix-turn-helix transcriptional regulator [Mycolicibacter longobardus]|uniref:Transcriptional regulator n=1 Tax=Mycolicibacter longobardus TaxID=1108812 RepID=A0A1X1YLV0_9MYCO|nr:WYL domain-containing protein [Mycolicibacter longobardus]MCV7384620.1 WYL domain-containing protein [Mycolicibacter longobardus]ORW11991.1 transcriptional regulator [Mycolicibacter longobardus]